MHVPGQQQQHSVATAHTWLRIAVKQGCAESRAADGTDVAHVAAVSDLRLVETQLACLAGWVRCHSCTVRALCLDHGREQQACVSHDWRVWCEALQHTAAPAADAAAAADTAAVAPGQGVAQELPAVHVGCLE